MRVKRESTIPLVCQEMNNNKQVINSVDLAKDLAASLVLKDSMISLNRLKEVVSSHLVIFSMNLRNSLEVLKEEDPEDNVVAKLSKEGKI